MSVNSRSLDSSLQKVPLDVCVQGALTNGETGVLAHVPWPCAVLAAQLACFNTTSNAYIMLTVNRFIVGQGFTTIVLGSTFKPPAFGTSGVIPNGVSLPASGSTLLLLAPNDVIMYQVGGGALEAIWGMVGSLVVQPLQDIRTFMGTLA